MEAERNIGNHCRSTVRLTFTQGDPVECSHATGPARFQASEHRRVCSRHSADAEESAIAQAFGTFDAWESEFRKIGQGLGGGSGWVVLGYNGHLQLLENYWLADHAHNPPHTRPILVMDMYEHAYHVDFGAAAAKYIDAFFANVNWDEVSKRVST